MSDQFENDFENEAAETGVSGSTEATETAAMQASAEATLSEVAGHPVIIQFADENVVAETPAAEEAPAEEPGDDDFFEEDDAPAVPEVDPMKVITVRTSQGSDVYVPAEQPMPLVDAIAKSGLRFNGDFTCWLNGQEVGLGTQVAGGMTVTVVGSVKGGQR